MVSLGELFHSASREVSARNLTILCFKQDWYIGVRIVWTKTAPEKLAMASHIRRVRSYSIRAVQSYDKNDTEAMTEHTRKHSALFGDDNGQYFASAFPRCLEKVTWTDPTNDHLDAPPPPPPKKKRNLGILRLERWREGFDGRGRWAA